jgi:hypothetical protein
MFLFRNSEYYFALSKQYFLLSVKRRFSHETWLMDIPQCFDVADKTISTADTINGQHKMAGSRKETFEHA